MVKSSVKKPEMEKLEVKLDLPKKLEKCLEHLVKISGQPKEFIVYEALVRYIEDMEDIQKYSVLEALGELEKIRKGKTYTPEELNKKLGI